MTTRSSMSARLRSRMIPGVALVALAAMFSGCSTCGRPGGLADKATVTTAEFQHAEDSVRPALVRIHVVETDYRNGREEKFEASGSGAIFSADGLVVTNHHVAGNATRLFVTLPSREEIPAELVGTDALSDIAVLRLKPYKPTTFPVAKWGDSDTVKVGDPVLAMGSPLSLSQSITLGIVSNTEMILPSYAGAMELDGEDVGSIVRWIGHDATIFPGNSGGPLVNLRGEIIGINEIGFGLAGAIPANVARPVAEELVRHGRIERAHIGTVFQPLLKSQHDLDGVLVSSVLKDSPAAAAGVEPGDFLTAINGEPVTVRFGEELPPLNLRVARLPLGKPVTLTLRRGNETLTKTCTPVERELVSQRQSEIREWGLTARNLSLWTTIDLNRPNKDGVLVTSVSDGGGAGTAKPPLQRGDVIVSVKDKPVRNLAEFLAITGDIVKDQKAPVPTPVVFERSGKQILTVAKIGIPKPPEPSVDAKKAWVPIDTQVVTRDIAKALGRDSLKGVRVTQVYGSKAEGELPFQVGDILTAIDGDPIAAAEPHDSELFGEMVRQYKAGTKVEFTLLRNGAESKVSYELPLRPPTARELRAYRNLDFELEVREATYLDRQDPSWKAGRDASVVVQSVTPGGWAALAGLKVGDKVLEIGGKPIAQLDDVRSILEGLRAQRPQFLVIKAQRGPHTVFVEIEPAWK